MSFRDDLTIKRVVDFTLQWSHNGRDGVSNHQPYNCLLNRLFRLRSKKTLKLRVTGLCEGNSPVTSEFPAQRASNAENVSIWLRHHNVDCFGNIFTNQSHLKSGFASLRLLRYPHNLRIKKLSNCHALCVRRGGPRLVDSDGKQTKNSTF